MEKLKFNPGGVHLPVTNSAAVAKFCCEHLGFVPGIESEESLKTEQRKVVLYGSGGCSQEIVFFNFGVGAIFASSTFVLKAQLTRDFSRHDYVQYLIKNGAEVAIVKPAETCSCDFAIFRIPGGVQVIVEFIPPPPLTT